MICQYPLLDVIRLKVEKKGRGLFPFLVFVFDFLCENITGDCGIDAAGNCSDENDRISFAVDDERQTEPEQNRREEQIEHQNDFIKHCIIPFWFGGFSFPVSIIIIS